MNKLIVLTGTSRGLGKGLFELLTRSENTIIAISLAFDDNIEKQSEKIILVQQDLSEPTTLLGKLNQVKFSKMEFDSLIFINNAGTVTPIKPVGIISQSEIIESVNINLISPIIITNFLANIAETKKVDLKIINISSGAAIHPIAYWPMYCSTKAGFRMFLDVLAKQDSNKTIDVVQFDPGVMNTTIQKQIRSTTNVFPDQKQFIGLKNAGKLQSPKKVAERIIKDFI